MAMLNTKDRPVHAIAEDLAAGVYTSAELTADYIARVEKEDNVIKAFLKLDKEAVMLAAEESDRRRASGSPLSPYDGIPVGIKDCIVAEGETCSCASKILEPVVSPYDSTAVARLKANGFIPFGRLNMDEFAMGSSCENSAFQKTANPRDPQRVPGGSSGGSAACVAASFAAAEGLFPCSTRRRARASASSGVASDGFCSGAPSRISTNSPRGASSP